MDYTEFKESIVKKLSDLADTEHNRKKKKIEADLNTCLMQIEANKAALEKAIAEDQYDEAVTVKETISKLNSKSELLENTLNQLNSVPIYSDDDLRNLSWEVTRFFNMEIFKNLNERLKILVKLDDNDQTTQHILDSYNEIKGLVDKNTINENYDYGVSCGSFSYYASCNDKHELERKIESIKKD